MCNKIKFFLVLTVFLGLGVIALAQEAETPPTQVPTDVAEMVALDEEVRPEDLEIRPPRILPDHPLYFLKNWGRSIRSFFTFNPVAKARLKTRFADEKLMELKKMIEEKKNPEVLKRVAENYRKEIEEIKKESEKIRQTAQENPRVSSFLDKFIKHQTLHQRILQKLEKQVPEEVFQKIKEVRERHLERFKDVMLKLEEKEKLPERLEKNLQELKGSKFKHFKNLEILMELEEKVPEEAKEAIRRAQENAFKRLKGMIEKISPEDQEKFKQYLERIGGLKEKHFEILENLKSELKDKPEIRERIMKSEEKILEKIKEKITKERCPIVMDWPTPGFCPDIGRIVAKKDERGCITAFECVIPGEIELPPLPSVPEKPQACITLWNPVCGEDGKTYSNACFAKMAGVRVAYKGRCKEKECLTDADCPQPRCGPMGTLKERCIGVSAKCIEGRCRIQSTLPLPTE